MEQASHLGLIFALALTTLLPVAPVTGGELQLSAEKGNLVLQVRGDADDEWRFQTSSDLLTWSDAPALGTLFSRKTDPPSLSLSLPSLPRSYYRALKTDGLYDPKVLRTVSLTFPQANWQTLLAAYKASGSNLIASLTMDGMTLPVVGVRYKGNTSYTGMGAGGAPTKKSINLEVDYTNTTARLMGYRTINLNNAYGDESIMREPLYFNVMRAYAVCPQANFAKLHINGVYWGVYSCVQQQDADLIDEWFSNNEGDRWRAPNMPGGTGGGPPGPGGGGGGGGFAGGTSALRYLGATVASYKSNYELKSDNSPDAWDRLLHATDVLNNTPVAQLRDAVEDVLAVDRWLWFLALENVFADDDSYFNKGADYMFYYEPESGRIHPVEHDGNESFVAGDVQLSPVQGVGNTNRPVISRLLALPELRQRYLAHMRTALAESFNPATLNPRLEQYRALTLAAITEDSKKGYTMTAYASDVAALKNFIQQRYTFLTNHAELRPLPPLILSVTTPDPAPAANETGIITAEVRPHAADGLDSVWLYHRGKSYGRFTTVPMYDDGLHGDGDTNDGRFGAAATSYPAGTKVRYYVEARSANTAKAAAFAPARAEQETYSYRVALTTASATPVVLNELMADNTKSLADPQGEYDDWIELHNVTDLEVDLTGRFLSDEPNNPRKWAFPEGTKIPANGYLLVWADEDGDATPGLHASFKLSASGEQVFLTDTDQNLNAVLDTVTFGALEPDLSYGRSAADADRFEVLVPTPGQPNP